MVTAVAAVAVVDETELRRLNDFAVQMARQLYDLQQGNRDGAWSDLMDAAVANLTVRDIVDIVAYTASLEP